MRIAKDYSHFILFSKGHYETNGNYFQALRRIASNWNGIEEKHVTDTMVYNITIAAIEYIKPISAEKYNDILFLHQRMNPNLTFLELFIRTNMSVLNDLSAKDVGGDWDWIQEAKDNLINMEFESV